MCGFLLGTGKDTHGLTVHSTPDLWLRENTEVFNADMIAQRKVEEEVQRMLGEDHDNVNPNT